VLNKAALRRRLAAEGRRPRRIALEGTAGLASANEMDTALADAEKRASGLGRHAQLCVEAVRCGVEQGGSAGLEKVRVGCCDMPSLPPLVPSLACSSCLQRLSPKVPLCG
jgi:hypothetical protein